MPLLSAQYFNPRAPCGARLLSFSAWSMFLKFQSTRPLRGATVLDARQRSRLVISIHAPLAGRDGRYLFHPQCHCISIHAPLAGRDPRQKASSLWGRYFNPRAPCGARRDGLMMDWEYRVFQSTRPLRGATAVSTVRIQRQIFQSTRPLRGATGRSHGCLWRHSDFNPRAPCGARPHGSSSPSDFIIFQSTRPLRGATRAQKQ